MVTMAINIEEADSNAAPGKAFFRAATATNDLHTCRDETDHLALSFTFWAPTGSFEKGRLVNLSTNTWTFIPGIAYTKILPQANIELTGIWQMEFDTEDPATHYQNGILSDLEALAIKRFKNGF